MSKSTIETLMKIYAFIVNIFRKVQKPIKHLEKFKLPIEEFNKLINTYEYKKDPLGGLIDMVGSPDDFFEDKEYNRDCDNFANVICINAVMNGYKADEYIICDPSTVVTAFKTMHIIAVLEKDDEFILANYNLYRGFKSAEDALDYMKYFPSYKKDRVIVHSREIKLK